MGKGRTKALTDEEIAKVREDYMTGNFKMIELANKYFVSGSTINTYLEGYKPNGGKKKTLTAEEIAEIRRRRDAGARLQDLAKDFHVGYLTLYEFLGKVYKDGGNAHGKNKQTNMDGAAVEGQ